MAVAREPGYGFPALTALPAQFLARDLVLARRVDQARRRGLARQSRGDGAISMRLERDRRLP